jgi:hypothetical protein
VDKIKEKYLNLDSQSDLENNGRRHIIDIDTIATVATTTIQLEESTNPKDGSTSSIHRCG